jgi:hypothetical protein
MRACPVVYKIGNQMFVATIEVVRKRGVKTNEHNVVSVLTDSDEMSYVEHIDGPKLLNTQEGEVQTFLNALLDSGPLSVFNGEVDITLYTTWESLYKETPFGLQVILVGEGMVTI